MPPCFPSLGAIAAAEGRPLALIEVGASAGLALFPDRYSYEFDDGVTVTRLGPGGSGGGAVGTYPAARDVSGDAGASRPALPDSGPGSPARRLA